MAELITFGETMLRLSTPLGERLETSTDLEVRIGGAESNVAVAASRLGANAKWLSKLPDSPLGRRVTYELNGHGVETEIAWSDSERQGLYFIEHGSAPRETNVVYDRSDAAIQTARPEEFDLSAIEEAAVFYTGGITPALSDQLAETTEQLLQIAQDAGTTTAFDINYRSKLWSPEDACERLTGLLPKVDILLTAERDARTVFGYDGSAEEIIAALDTDFGFETIIMTRGSDGAFARHNGELFDQPAYKSDAVDSVGTGDAFAGAFFAKRINGGDIVEALEYGSAAASLKRTMAGDLAIVTPSEIEELLSTEESSSRILR